MREHIKEPRRRNKKGERGESVTIFYSTLVLMFTTYASFIEFSYAYCLYWMGFLHYRTWLVYCNDELTQNALGLHEKSSWMHPTSFDWRAFIHL